MKKSKKEMFLKIKNILLVVLGTFVLAFGTGVFLINFNLITGGMSGIAIVLHALIPSISIEIYVYVITWLLFFIGLFVLGKEFALKTLISAIVYPVALSISLLIVKAFPILDMTTGNYKEIALLLSSLFGGALVGAGCAITFIGGGSTGGTDILAFIVTKCFPKLKSSKVIFVIDALIVIAGLFVIGDAVITMLGIFSAFVCALVIDKLFLGESSAFCAYIVSSKYEEISNQIISKLDRTTTIFDATGGFTKKGRKVIMVSFSYRQYADMLSIIRNIDSSAFVSISRAFEINGEGWTTNGKK